MSIQHTGRGVGAASAFAALHHGAGPLVLPNAWDVASAVLLGDAGFSAIGTTALASQRRPVTRAVEYSDLQRLLAES